MTRFYDEDNFWTDLSTSMGSCKRLPYTGLLQNACKINCFPLNACDKKFKELYQNIIKLRQTNQEIKYEITKKYRILLFYAKKKRDFFMEELTEETVISPLVDTIMENHALYKSMVIFRKCILPRCQNSANQAVHFGIPDLEKIEDNIDRNGTIIVEIEEKIPGTDKYQTVGILEKQTASTNFNSTKGRYAINNYTLLDDIINIEFSKPLSDQNKITIIYTRQQKADLIQIIPLKFLARKLIQNNPKSREMKDEEKGKYVVRLKQVSKRNQSWQDIHTNEGVAQNPPTRDCVPYKPPIPYNEVVSSVVVGLLPKNRLADAVYQKWETWNKQNQVSKWQEFLDRGIISQEEDNWLNGKIDSKPKEYSIGRFVTFLMSALRKHFQILILQQIEKDIADSCFQLIKEKDRVLLQQLLKFNYCECNDTNVLYVKKGDLTKAFKKLIILFSSKFNAKYCEEFHEINSRVCGGL